MAFKSFRLNEAENENHAQDSHKILFAEQAQLYRMVRELNSWRKIDEGIIKVINVNGPRIVLHSTNDCADILYSHKISQRTEFYRMDANMDSIFWINEDPRSEESWTYLLTDVLRVNFVSSDTVTQFVSTILLNKQNINTIDDEYWRCLICYHFNSLSAENCNRCTTPKEVDIGVTTK